MQVKINKPSTVYIYFRKGTPKMFNLYDEKGKLYYFRYTDGKVPRIKFNIPDAGNYNSNNNFEITKIVPIEVPDDLPKLPPAERDRLRNEVIKFNPNLTDTPVRIFTEKNPALIETSKEFYQYPNPVKLYLLLHEKGHQFYKTEEYCDLYALVNFIRLGYNPSTGYYCLIKILRRSKQNVDRIKNIMKSINQFTVFDPGI